MMVLDTTIAPTLQNVANGRPVGVRQFSVARLIGRGRCGLRTFDRVAGNRMGCGKPGAQIDQAAAIAAEWPVWKLIAPLNRALTGRTPQSLDHGAT